MNPEDMQMNPDDAKASLGIATALQDQLMPQIPQEVQKEEIPQEQAENQQPQEDIITPRMEELEGKFTDLEKEIKALIKDEISGMKDMIKEALSEDDKTE